MTKSTLFVLFTFTCLISYAQSFENKGWIFLTHTQKISKKWDILADIQVRSSDKIKMFETILLRGAASYHFSENHSAALGYAYKGDWEEESAETIFKLEHRVYEQYIFDSKIKRTELTARLRLEQRFIKEDAAFEFSQRVRTFLSFQIPLVANHDFSKGVYTTLQNELFLNVHHKEEINGSFFDQNRIMGSVGYRWNSSIDTEIGYIYWRQKEFMRTSNSNVVQLMITTKL